MSKDLIESLDDYINEDFAVSYDEPYSHEKTSIEQKDYQYKQKLAEISNTAAQIEEILVDGEEIGKENLETIEDIFVKINKLKDVIINNKENKAKEYEEDYENINNPNL